MYLFIYFQKPDTCKPYSFPLPTYTPYLRPPRLFDFQHFSNLHVITTPCLLETSWSDGPQSLPEMQWCQQGGPLSDYIIPVSIALDYSFANNINTFKKLHWSDGLQSLSKMQWGQQGVSLPG